MEFLLALFALPFWALIILFIVFVADIALIHNNRVGTGSVLLVLTAAILGYGIAGVNPFMFLWNNLWTILLSIPIWLIIGGVWSVVKWYFFSIDNARKLKKAGAKKRSRDTFWFNNKTRITGWIIHWPFSMLGFIFGDMLSRLASKVWGSFSGIYTSIEKKVYKDFEDDPKGW